MYVSILTIWKFNNYVKTNWSNCNLFEKHGNEFHANRVVLKLQNILTLNI